MKHYIDFVKEEIESNYCENHIKLDSKDRRMYNVYCIYTISGPIETFIYEQLATQWCWYSRPTIGFVESSVRFHMRYHDSSINSCVSELIKDTLDFTNFKGHVHVW